MRNLSLHPSVPARHGQGPELRVGVAARAARLAALAIVAATAAHLAVRHAAAQEAAFDSHRPGLAFRAEWKRQEQPQHPLVQGDVIEPRLELKLYGDQTGMLWTQHKDEPVYAWTGFCKVNCAVAFRDREHFIDMSGLAKIRLRSRQSGFHALRPIVKLQDGTWLAGTFAEGAAEDWKVSEINLRELRWRRLDISKVVEAAAGNSWIERPDLSRVDEVGVTDLMVGSGHGEGAPASRLAWLEVYGRPVSRTP